MEIGFASSYCLLETIQKQGAVGKSSQGIMEGIMAQLFFKLFPVGDIPGVDMNYALFSKGMIIPFKKIRPNGKFDTESVAATGQARLYDVSVVRRKKGFDVNL